MADTADLGSAASAWGFESPQVHQTPLNRFAFLKFSAGDRYRIANKVSAGTWGLTQKGYAMQTNDLNKMSDALKDAVRVVAAGLRRRFEK